jgi:hypothetical protein
LAVVELSVEVIFDVLGDGADVFTKLFPLS